jgi:hypothetical protein
MALIFNFVMLSLLIQWRTDVFASEKWKFSEIRRLYSREHKADFPFFLGNGLSQMSEAFYIPFLIKNETKEEIVLHLAPCVNALSGHEYV